MIAYKIKAIIVKFVLSFKFRAKIMHSYVKNKKNYKKCTFPRSFLTFQPLFKQNDAVLRRKITISKVNLWH